MKNLFCDFEFNGTLMVLLAIPEKGEGAWFIQIQENCS